MINYTWNTPSCSEAISVQNELSRKIVLSSNGVTTFDAVAGIDLAYWKVHALLFVNYRLY